MQRYIRAYIEAQRAKVYKTDILLRSLFLINAILPLADGKMYVNSATLHFFMLGLHYMQVAISTLGKADWRSSVCSSMAIEKKTVFV